MTASPVGLEATSTDLLRVAAGISEQWREADAAGGFLARNLATGAQLGFDVDEALPIASVMKVPLALRVLESIEAGVLDGGRAVRIVPGTGSPGPTGLATFEHPVTIAIADLVTQMLTVSDNVAGDTLLEIVGIVELDASLRRWGCPDIRVRHSFQRMFDCAMGVAGDDFELAMQLALQGDRPGEQHAIETLDPAKANTATAAALVDLLEKIWLDEIATPEATRALRARMSKQLFSHRLSSDLRTDSYRISAKTGTFLNLRHEIGVVETASGDRIAIAALTRSSLPAMTQQSVDLAIGAAARTAVEALRAT